MTKHPILSVVEKDFAKLSPQEQHLFLAAIKPVLPIIAKLFGSDVATFVLASIAARPALNAPPQGLAQFAGAVRPPAGPPGMGGAPGMNPQAAVPLPPMPAQMPPRMPPNPMPQNGIPANAVPPAMPQGIPQIQGR